MWSNIVELRWPFLPGIAAFDIFFDAVVPGDSDSPFVLDASLSNWKFSFGFGPRICMPQFPLRFLFTFPFHFDDTGAFAWRTEDNAGFTFVLSFNIVNK